MPYNHELYLANCRKMVVANSQQVESTKRALKRAGSPATRAELQSQLEGWEEWVRVWKQRLADAEAITVMEEK